MEIRLHITGGMGIPLTGNLTSDDLPGHLIDKIQQALETGVFAKCEKAAKDTLRTELQNYNISIKTDRDPQRIHTFVFEESQVPEDMFDVLDELTSIVTSKLLKQRKDKP